MFRVATREMRGDQWCNKWPALLDYPITVPADAPFFLNNQTINATFDTMNNIYEFIKTSDLKQTIPDHRKNILYTIYHRVEVDDELKWEPYYSLRPKLFYEGETHYTNDLGQKDSISYIRVDVNHIIDDPNMVYSTSMLELNTSKYSSWFEGIFPVTINNKKDKAYKLQYVLPLSELIIITPQTEIHLAKYNHNKKPSWVPGFLEKLEMVQVELEKIYYNKGIFEKSTEYLKMIEQITLLYNKYNTFQITQPMPAPLQSDIEEILSIPIFYDGMVYQIKYNGKIITWHKLYQYMIDTNHWVPSDEFFSIISDINIFTWKEQYSEQNFVFNTLEALVVVCEENGIIEPVYTFGDRVTEF